MNVSERWRGITGVRSRSCRQPVAVKRCLLSFAKFWYLLRRFLIGFDFLYLDAVLIMCSTAQRQISNLLTPGIKALSQFGRVVTTTYTGLHYNSYVVFAKFLDHGNVLIGSFIKKKKLPYG